MKVDHKLALGIMLMSTTLMITSCNNKDDSAPARNLAGIVQKGPFINGSSMTVSDLKADLSPTGRTFETQITDDKGIFQVKNASFTSNFIGLKADGFYFNEITGKQSSSQITLYAISDVTNKSSVNVNILTDLEMPRVEYLVSGGKTFADAKKQAQQEVMAIFNIYRNDTRSSEDLDISVEGPDNGILLAISSIVQGFRTESEMSELLANISNDIKEDGILDGADLGSALINHAKYIDTLIIRNNLLARYSEIGAAASIPAFGKYISDFIAGTEFVVTGSPITYPESATNPDNILSLTQTTYNGGFDYTHSLAANLAPGTSLKIRITALSTDLDPVPVFYRSSGSEVNWTIQNFDFATYSQTFTATETGKSCDLTMFFDPGTFLVEYFEMNSEEPARTKTIVCN